MSGQDVSTLKEWADEPLSDGDKAAFAALVASETSDNAYGEMMRDPTARRVAKEGGEIAMRNASDAAARLIGSQQDEHWTRNPETKKPD